MHIVVCLKQVPNTADVKIDPKTNTLIREGVESIINPFDMYAIEEAVRLKEKLGGHVTALTMGPPQAENALRDAIAMGVDQGVLVSDRAFAGSDTWATSYTLSMALRKLDFSLVLCGKQASDGDTAQVGPGIAAHLNLPQITYVRKIEAIDPHHVVAERLLEDGYETIDAPLPCLLTVVKEINEPRLPSLKGKLAAKKAHLTHWKAADLQADARNLGLEGSPTKVVRIFTPPARTGGQVFTGEPETIVPQVAEKLRDVIIAAAS